MKSIMVSLILVSLCFAGSMYSMEQQNRTEAEKSLLKAQKAYNKGQKVISDMEFQMVFSCCPDQESYAMHVATERSKANTYYCKSRCYIQCILHDKNANEVTKKTALDIEKNIDAISWASK